jgi:hypothetical protein
MKKLFLLLTIALTVIIFEACGHNSAKSGVGNGDSSANAVKPASNSDATNPSLADTGYSKNYADTTKQDSSKMSH